MGTKKQKQSRDLGSVMTYVISPTRAVLVKEESKDDAQWKLPGGIRERWDKNIIATAVRKVKDETGISLLPEEVVLDRKEVRISGTYYPHFCVARVSEEKLDTRLALTTKGAKVMTVSVFAREEVLVMRTLLDRHRSFIRSIDGYRPLNQAR